MTLIGDAPNCGVTYDHKWKTLAKAKSKALTIITIIL